MNKDLSKLNYKRLQNYRKSLSDKIVILRRWYSEEDKKCKEVKEELQKVLQECRKRNGKIKYDIKKTENWIVNSNCSSSM
jgi:DNA-binding Lrp family transcriptional regulator